MQKQNQLSKSQIELQENPNNQSCDSTQNNLTWIDQSVGEMLRNKNQVDINNTTDIQNDDKHSIKQTADIRRNNEDFLYQVRQPNQSQNDIDEYQFTKDFNTIEYSIQKEKEIKQEQIENLYNCQSQQFQNKQIMQQKEQKQYSTQDLNRQDIYQTKNTKNEEDEIDQKQKQIMQSLKYLQQQSVNSDYENEDASKEIQKIQEEILKKKSVDLKGLNDIQKSIKNLQQINNEYIEKQCNSDRKNSVNTNTQVKKQLQSQELKQSSQLGNNGKKRENILVSMQKFDMASLDNNSQKIVNQNDQGDDLPKSSYSSEGDYEDDQEFQKKIMFQQQKSMRTIKKNKGVLFNKSTIQQNQEVVQKKMDAKQQHQIWIRSFFKILIYVSKFISKSKLVLLFFRPQDLSPFQLSFINDLSAKSIEDGWSKFDPYSQQQNENRIFRIIRKNKQISKIQHLIKKIFSFMTKPFILVFRFVRNAYNNFNLIPTFDPFSYYHITCIWLKFGFMQLQYQEDHQGWIRNYEMEENTCYDIYISSFYYAVITITTVGYGDISPSTKNEKLLVIILVLLSCANYAYTINYIGQILGEMNQRKLIFQQKMASINNYFNNHNVSQTLQSSAQRYLEYMYQMGMDKKVDPDEELKDLSLSLKEDILKNVFSKSLHDIHIFNNTFSDLFIEAVCRLMKEQIYGSKEYIVQPKKSTQMQLLGDQPPQLYYIAQGNLEILLEKQVQDGTKVRVLKQLKKGDYFGQIEFFTNKQSPTYSIISKEISRIYSLNYKDFISILQNFPEDKEKFYLIKDELSLNKNYNQIKEGCWSCHLPTHCLKQCPYLFYRIRNNIVSKLYNDKEQKFRKQFQRKQKIKQKQNSLQLIDQVYDQLYDFLEDNYSDLGSLKDGDNSNQDSSEDFDLDLENNNSLLYQNPNIQLIQKQKSKFKSSKTIQEEINDDKSSEDNSVLYEEENQQQQEQQIDTEEQEDYDQYKSEIQSENTLKTNKILNTNKNKITFHSENKLNTKTVQNQVGFQDESDIQTVGSDQQNNNFQVNRDSVSSFNQVRIQANSFRSINSQNQNQKLKQRGSLIQNQNFSEIEDINSEFNSINQDQSQKKKGKQKADKNLNKFKTISGSRKRISLLKPFNPQSARKSTACIFNPVNSVNSKLIQNSQLEDMQNFKMTTNQKLKQHQFKKKKTLTENSALSKDQIQQKINNQMMQKRVNASLSTQFQNLQQVLINQIQTTLQAQQQDSYQRRTTVLKSHNHERKSNDKMELSKNMNALADQVKDNKNQIINDPQFYIFSDNIQLDSIKSYQIYFPHNNIEQIEQKLNEKARQHQMKYSKRKTIKYTYRKTIGTIAHQIQTMYSNRNSKNSNNDLSKNNSIFKSQRTSNFTKDNKQK